MAHSSRGRGQGTASKIQGDTKKKSSRAVKSIDDLSSYLYSLSLSNISVYGHDFAEMVFQFGGTDDSKLEEVVNLIFETSVSDRAYSDLGAAVCHVILEKESPACEVFMEKLMHKLQSELKVRKETRQESVEQWLGLFAFLCEVYNQIKVAGAPIKVVGSKILSLTLQMLTDDDVIDDEIDCICSKLKICGKLLENECPEKIEKIFTELRKLVITKRSSSVRRCYILEIIEFRRMEWSDSAKVLDKFYPDAVADAMVEDEGD